MKNTQIPQRSRLMGLHNRWHVKKGRVVATCSFCQEPNVKNTVGKESVPQVKSPATIEQDETDRELEAFKIKAQFRETVWSAAQTGLSVLEAARCAKLELVAFVPMVEAEFKESYQDLVETARLDNLRSITLAALQAAKAGDVKLLLRLEERGIFNNWLRQEKDAAENLKKVSTTELEERIRKYFVPSKSYESFQSDSLKVTSASEEDVRAFEAKEPAAYVVKDQKPCPTPVVTPALCQDQERSPEPDTVEVQAGTRDDEAFCVDDEPKRPVTYTPPDALPFTPRITREDMR